MYVSVVLHHHGGLSGCPLASGIYRTWRHPVELWITSWIHGPISGLSSWGDVLGHSSYWSCFDSLSRVRAKVSSYHRILSLRIQLRPLCIPACYVTPSMLPSMVMAIIHLDSSGMR